MRKSLNKKQNALKKLLREMKRVVIAYSGGVDSTFLLYTAESVLGKKNVLAVTASSESYPQFEKRHAKELAKKISVNHVIIKTEELANKNFKKNPVNRCYYCKKELFGKLKKIAKKKGFYFVLDGSNHDDLKDMRYGRLAAQEEDIKSPLLEAGLVKDEIRRLSKEMGIETWKKPSFACLASRFVYHQKITREKLESIEKAEAFIKGLGFNQLRVRCHEDIARIEVDKAEISKFMRKDIREKIVKRLRNLGFIYVSLDLAGYRTGSMNETVSQADVLKPI